MKYNLRLVFFVLFLSSCATIKKNKNQSGQSKEVLQDVVARLTMIPDVPLGFKIEKVVHDASCDDNVQIVYTGNKKQKLSVGLDQLASMYRVDMETLGWNCVTMFCGERESLLLCMRPENVWCQILITDTATITLTIMNEKK